MNVRLDDDQLIITWQRTSSAQHALLVSAVKAAPGVRFDSAGKRWLAPLKQADRLYDALANYGFAFDDDAMAAVEAARQRHAAIFYRNLAALGIPYEWEGECLIIVGDHAGTLQKFADKYCSIIRQMQEAQ